MKEKTKTIKDINGLLELITNNKEIQKKLQKTPEGFFKIDLSEIMNFLSATDYRIIDNKVLSEILYNFIGSLKIVETGKNIYLIKPDGFTIEHLLTAAELMSYISPGNAYYFSWVKNAIPVWKNVFVLENEKEMRTGCGLLGIPVITDKGGTNEK